MTFSIIMPVHNKAPHLRKSINSVLNQTYKKFELILIDDASTDGSSFILDEFTDKRVRIERRGVPGPGGYAARNLGIKMSNHEWISFLDADDEWEPTYLEHVFYAACKFPSCDIFSTKWDHVYGSKIVLNQYFERFSADYISFTLVDFFRHNYFIWTSAVTIRKSLLITAGMFPENRCKRGGDVDAWIRCLHASENPAVWINKKLAHYHKETVNRVTDNSTNPVNDVCAIASIEAIRQQTNDRHILKAIDYFLAKVHYNKMVVGYRYGHKYNMKSELSIIQSFAMRMKVKLKFFLRTRLLERGARKALSKKF